MPAKIPPTQSEIDALNKEAKSLYDKLDLKQATNLSNKAYKLATKQKYPKGIAEALMMKGCLFWIQQENLQAREVFMQAYKIIVTLDDNEILNHVYNRLGITYGQLLLNEESIKYFTKALDVSNLMKNDPLIASSYINLAIALMKLHNYPQAIELFIKAMNYAKKLSDDKMQAIILANLSALYINKGGYETALQYCFDALKIAENINETGSIITIYSNISSCFLGLGHFDEAEHYAKLCLSLSAENNVAPYITRAELLRAEINIFREKYEEAKDILQSIENLPSFKGYVEAIYKYYELYLKIYEATGDYKKAYEKQKELTEFERKQAEANLDTKLELLELKLKFKS